MRDITLRQLEFFVAAVEEASVSRAAQRLRVSPGGVSQAITQLEAALKIQLTVRRRGRGVGVTPAGKWAYEKARAVIQGAEDIFSVAKVVRGELAGSLRIGCFHTLSPWLIPRIVDHFSQQHPGVDLEIVEGASSDLQEQLGAGELHAALIYRNHLAPGSVGTDIIPVRLQLALAPTHRLASMVEVPLSELEHEDAILLGVEPAMGHVESLLRRAGVRVNVRWRSTNVETIRSMVARGLGYTIIMGRPYGDLTYDGLPIVYRRIGDHIESNAVVVALTEGTEPTEKVKILISFCRNEFRSEGQTAAKRTPAQTGGMGEL